jgi:hypothetical protein
MSSEINQRNKALVTEFWRELEVANDSDVTSSDKPTYSWVGNPVVATTAQGTFVCRGLGDTR